MPKQRIKELERERGDLEKVIPPLVNAHGQIRAAKLLKMSPATINVWLKANHYRKKITYEKETAS